MKEKIKILENISNILKSEFIGLDNIIDNIINSITPWYVTPNVIIRPVIVSLWGMTGTGKSSLVKRLIELLDNTDKTIFFDCGRENRGNNESNSDIIDRINYITGSKFEDETNSFNKYSDKNLIFVLDEFQFARSINESGTEINNSSLQPIWSLLDDGILISSNNGYMLEDFFDYISDFDSLIKTDSHAKNIPVFDLSIDKDSNRKFIDNSFFSYVYQSNYKKKKPEKTKKHGDEKDRVDLIDYNLLKYIIKKLNSNEENFGYKFRTDLYNAKTLDEFYKTIVGIKDKLVKQKSLDCSKSLIFVIGNLDEAFKESKDLNPDIDADTLFEISNRVTIADIKDSLRFRFRAEQISRLGNNLIKYPSLNKKGFQKIIEKEISRLEVSFYNDNKIHFNVDDSIKELIYLEGVFPAQGVRPVLTTIGTILTPLLSIIILNYSKGDTVNISLENIEDLTIKKLKIPETSIKIYNDSGTICTKTIKLQLGELRNVECDNLRYVKSIHEMGHAIAMAYTTGNLPSRIVSVSVNNGGFCETFIKEKNKIDSFRDIKNDVIISLAGYCAEKLISPENDIDRLAGSSSDINYAWTTISRAAYYCGYFYPSSFSTTNVEIPLGLPDTLSIKDDSNNLLEKIKEEFNNLKNECESILNKEKELLLQSSIYLGDNGIITKEIFESFINKYGVELNNDYLINKREQLSGKNYLNKLKSLLTKK